jgi:hypothetical protein
MSAPSSQPSFWQARGSRQLSSENPPNPQFEEFKIEKGEMFTRLPCLGEHGLGGRYGMDGRP